MSLKKFANEVLTKLKSSFKTVVIGNESGDLDSIVSSLILAWHKHSESNPCVPAFNFVRKDLELRTEVTYVFGKANIDLSHALFLEDLEQLAPSIEVVLVDHNVINRPCLGHLERQVREVYDHHETKRGQLEQLRVADIQMVGSCTSIVAKHVMDQRPDAIKDPDFLDLVRATILLDTANLCAARKKAKALDLEILHKVEDALNSPVEARELLFQGVSNAKSSLEGFSVDMMLRKDMKMVLADTPRQTSMSTIPGLKCQDLLQRENFQSQVRHFAAENQIETVIILGSEGAIMMSPKADVLQAIEAKLIGPDLGFELMESQADPELRLFKRTNLAITRKQVMPMVERVLQTLQKQSK